MRNGCVGQGKGLGYEWLNRPGGRQLECLLELRLVSGEGADDFQLLDDDQARIEGHVLGDEVAHHHQPSPRRNASQ